MKGGWGRALASWSWGAHGLWSHGWVRGRFEQPSRRVPAPVVKLAARGRRLEPPRAEARLVPWGGKGRGLVRRSRA
eukprot:scaffold14470_cov107-Isochrysis_galbana.AAC.1